MIDQYTKLFNQNGTNYKALVFDKDSQENSVISNINDINMGALHNGLEWTRRWALRLIEESNLNLAKTFLLDSYGKMLGINRLPTESDIDYRHRIYSSVLLTVSTINNFYQLIKNENIRVSENLPSGFLDHSFLDVGIDIENSIAGFIFTFSRNSIYIVYNSIYEFENSMLLYLNNIKAAGTAIYIGFQFASKADFMHLGTELGFMDAEFFLADPPATELYLPPELLYLENSHINKAFIGV